MVVMERPIMLRFDEETLSLLNDLAESRVRRAILVRGAVHYCAGKDTPEATAARLAFGLPQMRRRAGGAQ